MEHNKLYLNWSSGKDAAFALYQLQEEGYTISKLLTTVNEHYKRISMHGLRESLLDAQVKALGINLEKVYLPLSPTMEDYNQIMQNCINKLKAEGYSKTAFGDIFLEDLRDYREKELAKQGIDAIFPLWKKNTKELLLEFINKGFKAITVCVNAQLLDKSFVGRIIDAQFINDLPENVDPCGENGEFHTFCFDGPIFQYPIAFERGENTYRSYPNPSSDKEDIGFWFCDLINKNE